MENLRELEAKINNWAKEKGILEKGTPIAQIGKTLEEVTETILAIEKKEQGFSYFVNKPGKIVNTTAEIKDGIGDTMVTLIILCKMIGFEPLDCLKTAYNEIKYRKGEMIDGTFVKD